MFASQIGQSVKNKESVANGKLTEQTVNDVVSKRNEIQRHSTQEQLKSVSEPNQKKITTQSSIQRRRQRVAKELGTRSTAFIGPTCRPVKRCAAKPKPDIEESLNDFYKELEQFEQVNSSIDTTDTNIPIQTHSGLVPLVPKGRSHKLEGKGTGPNHANHPHWNQNEPCHDRRHGSTQHPAYYHHQRAWQHPPPSEGRTQPYPRFHRLPHCNPPPPGPFGNPGREPQMNRSWGYPGPGNQYQQQCSQFPPLHRSPEPGRYNYSQVYGGVPPQYLDGDQGHSGYRGPTYEAVGYSDPYEDQDSDWIQGNNSQQQKNQHLPLNTTHNSSPHLVLILMRGVPGSGKSTLAKELLSTGPSGLVLSTDDYFSEEQDYLYDPSLLGKAHDWNHNRAKEAMQKGSSPVIIDNTNLQAWEMKPYVKLAVERGYSVLFHEPATSWKCDPVELERRNKHGVSREKIAQMLDRFEIPISVEIVMHSCEPPHQRMRQLSPNHLHRMSYN
ncbi:NEDD4-binding protein 2-like 2 isoform X1 [Osmerus eperlanus]|uniref:NEDD4-binding protein 2-like 2 isoform X1 n=1 Tax=Osmerus eperlanus TaxID=29151 RepID=UPI002E0F0415